MNEFPLNPVSCQPLTDRRPKSVKLRRGTCFSSTTSSTIHLDRLVCATERYSDRPGSHFVNRVNKGLKRSCCVISHGGRQLWRPPALVCV